MPSGSKGTSTLLRVAAHVRFVVAFLAAVHALAAAPSAIAGAGCPGDVNNDGRVDNHDVDAFVQALTEPGACVLPGCARENADVNEDGAADHLDIDAFVEALARADCAAPELPIAIAHLRYGRPPYWEPVGDSHESRAEFGERVRLAACSAAPPGAARWMWQVGVGAEFESDDCAALIQLSSAGLQQVSLRVLDPDGAVVARGQRNVHVDEPLDLAGTTRVAALGSLEWVVAGDTLWAIGVSNSPSEMAVMMAGTSQLPDAPLTFTRAPIPEMPPQSPPRVVEHGGYLYVGDTYDGRLIRIFRNVHGVAELVGAIDATAGLSSPMYVHAIATNSDPGYGYLAVGLYNGDECWPEYALVLFGLADHERPLRMRIYEPFPFLYLCSDGIRGGRDYFLLDAWGSLVVLDVAPEDGPRLLEHSDSRQPSYGEYAMDFRDDVLFLHGELRRFWRDAEGRLISTAAAHVPRVELRDRWWLVALSGPNRMYYYILQNRPTIQQHLIKYGIEDPTSAYEMERITLEVDPANWQCLVLPREERNGAVLLTRREWLPDGTMGTVIDAYRD